MKSKFAVVVALAACLFLVTAGSASAATKTRVTIKEESGGFHGYVKSSKDRCVVSRVVVLLKKKPGKDKVIGTDYAEKNGMWSTGNTGSTNGAFYALAPKITGCAVGKSKTI
ncbi:MAG: hypothetical protein U0R51_10165 [Solirubrobacterales bacterium]